MDGPTLDQIRTVKTEMLRQFRDIGEFAGAGIGECGGHLCVRVNWRILPKDIALPSSMGEVEITHHEIGNVVPQSE
jgi:hypothetical protein